MRPEGVINRDADVVYHKATFEHMQLCPIAISTEMLDRLDARERAIGVRFPGALREWYALADAWSDLWWYIFVNRHGDSSFRVEGLGEPEDVRPAYGTGPYLDHLAAGYLPVLVEHQGEAEWALALDGSDDPPVVVAERPFGRPDRDGPDPSSWISPATATEVAWKPHAPSFSRLILARSWWCRFADWQYTLSAYQDEPVRPDDLASLRGSLLEGPSTTNWLPETINYQFGDDDDGVLFISSSMTGEPRFGWFDPDQRDQSGAACCRWKIWGASPTGLERLARRVLHCGQVRERIFGLGDSNVLGRRLRQAGP